MLVNYVFVITALPASIIILEKFSCTNSESSYISCCKLGQNFLKYLHKLYCYKLPLIVHKFAMAITLIAFAIGGLAAYTIVVNPGIRLPQNNPLQVRLS